MKSRRSRRCETDVDNHGNDVKTKSRTEVESRRRPPRRYRGVEGVIRADRRQQGVELASHVGQQVQVTAVALDAKKGDDDAKVKIEDETKVDRENAPDAKVKSRTEADTAARRSLEGYRALREDRGAVVQPTRSGGEGEGRIAAFASYLKLGRQLRRVEAIAASLLSFAVCDARSPRARAELARRRGCVGRRLVCGRHTLRLFLHLLERRRRPSARIGLRDRPGR